MMTGNATPAQIGRPADGAAGARRDGRGDHRRRARACASGWCGSRRRQAPSIPAGPAATPPAPTTSRPPPRIVVAGAGVPVAKHGNRGLSSKSGSAEVLTALGVNIDAELAAGGAAIREAGIGFMMAPRHHGAMRHVARAAGRAGHAHDLQPAGAVGEPGGRAAAADGRVRRRVDRAVGAGAGPPRLALRLGGPRQRRARRADHDRADARGRVGRQPGATVRGDAGGRRPAPCAGRGLKGDDPAAQRRGDPGGPRRVQGAAARRRGARRRRGTAGGGRAGGLREGAGLAAQSIDSGAAQAALARLVEITNSPAAP